MGVNVAATVGRIRYTPPCANTLSRLSQDAEKAEALALKLEEDLMGDDEAEPDVEAEGQPEPKVEGDGAKTEVKDEDGKDADKPAAKEKSTVPKARLSGLRESGSAVILEVLGRTLEAEGLDGDDLGEDQRLRKVRPFFEVGHVFRLWSCQADEVSGQAYAGPLDLVPPQRPFDVLLLRRTHVIP